MHLKHGCILESKDEGQIFSLARTNYGKKTTFVPSPTWKTPPLVFTNPTKFNLRTSQTETSKRFLQKAFLQSTTTPRRWRLVRDCKHSQIGQVLDTTSRDNTTLNNTQKTNSGTLDQLRTLENRAARGMTAELSSKYCRHLTCEVAYNYSPNKTTTGGPNSSST